MLFSDEAGEPPEPSKDQWRDAACGFYWTEGTRGLGWAHDAAPTLIKGGSTVGIPSAPAIAMLGGSLVTPHIRGVERLQGFGPGWTEPAEKVKRPGFRWLVGNAVSVNAAARIGHQLRDPGTFDSALHWRLAERRRTWPRRFPRPEGPRAGEAQRNLAQGGVSRVSLRLRRLVHVRVRYRPQSWFESINLEWQ